MPQAIVEAVASLRDSLANLTQRSFDDFAAFNSVAQLQFRANEIAKRLARLLAGGANPAVDTAVVSATLAASGKVSVAEPSNGASIVVAVDAATRALDGVDAWLATVGAATQA